MSLRSLSFFALGFAGLYQAAPTLTDRAASPVVALDYATYSGAVSGRSIAHYYGMRYAAAPLGSLRWQAPQDPPKTTDVQPATAFGNVCVGVGQTVGNSGLLGGQTFGEDCLYISVTTPAGATNTSNLPVLFYITGGGYAQESSINFNFDEFVRTSSLNVVVVQFNYRVGALGFLAGNEVKNGGVLNAGLLDQRKALEWTNKYIRNFGGDPNHVVLFGGSAGAGSVGLQLSAYGGRDDNLFVGAIGDAFFSPTVNNATFQEAQFSQFSSALGCSSASDQLNCLRGVDISKLQTANIAGYYPGKNLSAEYIWTPVIDGTYITDSPLVLFQQGKFVKVPLISGDVANEGTLFTPANTSSAADETNFLSANFPDLSASDLAQVNSLYQASPDYYNAAADAFGDATFVCPSNLIATTSSQFGNSSSIWRYKFNQSSFLLTAVGLGVPHNVDLGAIFGANVGPYNGPIDLSNGVSNAVSFGSFASENAASKTIMMNYIISFTRTLNPNTYKSSTAPTWTPFDASGIPQQVVVQNTGWKMQSVSSQQSSRCSFWNALIPKTRQ